MVGKPERPRREATELQIVALHLVRESELEREAQDVVAVRNSGRGLPVLLVRIPGGVGPEGAAALRGDDERAVDRALERLPDDGADTAGDVCAQRQCRAPTVRRNT